MVNLIAGRRIVPELINDRFNPAELAVALRPLLADTPARAQIIVDLAATRARLLPAPTANPIQRVCDVVEALLNPTQSGKGQTPGRSV